MVNSQELKLEGLEFVNANAREKRELERLRRERKRKERQRIAANKRETKKLVILVTISGAILFTTTLQLLAKTNDNVLTDNTVKPVIVEEKEISDSKENLMVEDNSINEDVTIEEDIENVEIIEVATPNYTYGNLEVSNLDIELFERIVMAESYEYFTEDEMLKIASVIRNRIESDIFPDTIHDVITQDIQFETYSNARYSEVVPNEACKNAVKRALFGDTNISTKILYFCTSEYYQVETNGFFHSLNNVSGANFRNVMMFTEN